MRLSRKFFLPFTSLHIYYVMRRTNFTIPNVFGTLLLVLLSGLLLGQSDTYRSTLASPLNAVSTEGEEGVLWTEDVAARTLTSSTYYSNDGQVKIRNSSRPINYYNEFNQLVPISTQLEKRNNTTWWAPNQPFPTFLHADGSMSLSTGNKTETISFGRNCKIDNQPVEFSLNEINETLIENVVPGVDKDIIFRENGVKYNYILREELNFNGDNLVFSEELDLPEGCKLIEDRSRGVQTEFGWSGSMQVIDQTGNVLATFYEALCYDGANQVAVASYRVKDMDGKIVLETVVSGEWLNSTDRVYPVVIDPIVTGPTTTWTGGSMPSCMIPSYNQDSILVNIPAGITITQLNVTASFYADPWTGAWMQDGAMYFSTDCANTSTFTITGPAGQTAGTAYLDYYNLYNPLTCCFPESCGPQSFYLSYHLGRSAWGTGCNTTYIRYDPLTTSWPFEAVVIGKTPESYGGQWSVPSASICADDCSISGVAYVYYGVAPYTFTHPWSNDTIVQGTNIGCGNGSTAAIMNLEIPNCPVFCDTVNTTLTVPPPTIIDACGVAVSGIPAEQVPLKPVPALNPIYDTLVCSGDPFVINLNSCIPGATLNWMENWSPGTGNIVDTITNNSGAVAITTYSASAEYNGCFSDTLSVPIYIQPLPIPSYTTNPDPVISNMDVNFTDASVFNGANGILWYYTFGDGQDSPDANPVHLYPNPGDYEVCLTVNDDAGCSNSICSVITVVPAELVAPNVVTANGDGTNDYLEFKYLEFYPGNHLTVVNRWGVTVFEKSGYTNDWSPTGHTEGIYYFLLKIDSQEKEYSGFFHLVK